MTASTAGGRVTWVMCSRCNRSASGVPGTSSSGGAITEVAPESSGRSSSESAASKLGEANCRTRQPGPSSQRRMWVLTRCGTPRWLTSTPLGLPVEPEV